MTVSKFLFAEPVLSRNAYRLIEVVATSEADARSRLPGRRLAFLATQSVRAAQPGAVRTRLYFDYATWARFLDKFFLRPEQLDRRFDVPAPGVLRRV